MQLKRVAIELAAKAVISLTPSVIGCEETARSEEAQLHRYIEAVFRLVHQQTVLFGTPPWDAYQELSDGAVSVRFEDEPGRKYGASHHIRVKGADYSVSTEWYQDGQWRSAIDKMATARVKAAVALIAALPAYPNFRAPSALEPMGMIL